MERGVIATLYLKVGTGLEVAKIIKNRLLAPSRTEPENIFYHIYYNPSKPDVVVVVEMYKNDAAIDNHMTADYFGKTIEELSPFFDSPPDLERYDVLA